MKHKIKGRKLNRTSSHRKALLINLSSALVRHEMIRTTLPKAKELRPFIEKLLTISKIDNLSNRRKLISVIKDKDLIKKLFSDIGSRIKNRNGGYTRIMHCGFRAGDKAPMAIIELVDRNISDDKSNKAANDSKNAKKTVKAKASKEDNDSNVKKDKVIKAPAENESAVTKPAITKSDAKVKKSDANIKKDDVADTSKVDDNN